MNLFLIMSKIYSLRSYKIFMYMICGNGVEYKELSLFTNTSKV